MQNSMFDSNVLTLKECGDLVGAIARHAQKKPLVHIAFWLMAGTGLRRNELLALRVEDFEGETVHVRDYMQMRRRVLPVLTFVAEGITNLSATQPQGLIFPGSHLDSCMRTIQAAGTDAGINKRITCRMLRNTFVALLRYSGAPLPVIWGFLGVNRRQPFQQISPIGILSPSYDLNRTLRYLTSK